MERRGQFATVNANDVFVDDHRLLTLSVEGADSVLRELTLPSRAVVWENAFRTCRWRASHTERRQITGS